MTGGLRRLTASAVAVVVLLTGCGLRQDGQPRKERQSFLDAARSLRSAPAITYSTGGPGAEVRLWTTRKGDTRGTIAYAGTKTDVLSVDGRSFMRFPEDPPLASRAEGLAGRWIGLDAAITPLLSTALKTPQALAGQIERDLQSPDTTYEEIPDEGGQPALKADTPGSDIYVSRTEPHEILRYDQQAAAPGATGLDKLLGGGVGSTRIEEVSLDDLADLYEQLMENVEELDKAEDTRFRFTLDGDLDLKCGPASCTATAALRNTLTGADVEGGKVTADMVVTLTADGAAAGSCSASGRLPVSGVGHLSCTVADPRLASIYSRARASGGRSIRYVAQARVTARAFAKAQIRRKVDQLRRDLDQELCGPEEPGVQPSHWLRSEQGFVLVQVAAAVGTPGCLAVLKNFKSRRFQFGDQVFLLDRKGMEHVLKRHHPKYWDGSTAEEQSFFPRKTTVREIETLIQKVLEANRDTLTRCGPRGQYQIKATVDGVVYVLGLNNGRVGQFYPPNKPDEVELRRC